MFLRYSVAKISLLTLMIAGCQSVLHFQQTPGDGWEEEYTDLLLDRKVDTDQMKIGGEFSGNEAKPPHPMVQTDTLTLSDLESIAFQNNPTLAAATARWRAAQGRQIQAGLYPNPVVGYHATEIGNLGTAGQEGGFFSQRIITGRKLQLDQEIAGKEVEAANFSLYSQEKRVLTDVRLRFYQALVSQRRVALTEQLVGIGEELVKVTKQLLKGRLGTENDLLQAQIRADQARILHDNALNEKTEAWRRLAATVGVPTMPMKQLDGQIEENLPKYNWDDCYELVLRHHPELSAAMARVQREKIAILRAKKEPIPNVDLLVSVRHNNATDSDVVNVQVGVPIPIFNRNQGNIHAAEMKWIASRKEVNRIELNLLDGLAQAFRRYANSRKQVDRYQMSLLPKAEKSLQLVTKGYKENQVKYLTLLTAQETFVNTNLAYLVSLEELWAAVALMEGQLLSDSLKKGIGSEAPLHSVVR